MVSQQQSIIENSFIEEKEVVFNHDQENQHHLASNLLPFETCSLSSNQSEFLENCGKERLTGVDAPISSLIKAKILIDKDESSGVNSLEKSIENNNNSQSLNNCNEDKDDRNARVVAEEKSESPDEREIDEASLWKIWGKIVTEWESKSKKNWNEIKCLVSEGIPDPFRGIVWQLLSEAHSSLAKKLYVDYLKQHSNVEKLIRRDITRTFPAHDLFKNKETGCQESLFNVLKAYSIHDSEVGYCQGSCFIVGLLLMHMPEEDAFSVLVQLMQKYEMRKIYKPSMSELGFCMYQFEFLLQENLPEIYNHFQLCSFHTSMYASAWFLTLFSSCLPNEFAFRIFDAFFIEGLSLIFKVGLALLQLSRLDLLALDMEGMLQYFQKEIPVRLGNSIDAVFATAEQFSYNEKKIKKLEKDYACLKVKEQEEVSYIKRMKQENRLLKHRNQFLEQESASLADKLIQGQIFRAQQEEEHFALKREYALSMQKQNKLMRISATAFINNNSNIDLLNKNNNNTSLNQQLIEKIRAYESLISNLEEELESVKEKEKRLTDSLEKISDKFVVLEHEHRQLLKVEKDHEIVQEELLGTKLQEAEVRDALQQLRQKVSDIQKEFKMYLDPSLKEAEIDTNNVKANSLTLQALSSFNLGDFCKKMLHPFSHFIKLYSPRK